MVEAAVLRMTVVVRRQSIGGFRHGGLGGRSDSSDVDRLWGVTGERIGAGCECASTEHSFRRSVRLCRKSRDSGRSSTQLTAVWLNVCRCIMTRLAPFVVRAGLRRQAAFPLRA